MSDVLVVEAVLVVVVLLAVSVEAARIDNAELVAAVLVESLGRGPGGGPGGRRPTAPVPSVCEDPDVPSVDCMVSMKLCSDCKSASVSDALLVEAVLVEVVLLAVSVEAARIDSAELVAAALVESLGGGPGGGPGGRPSTASVPSVSDSVAVFDAVRLLSWLRKAISAEASFDVSLPVLSIVEPVAAVEVDALVLVVEDVAPDSVPSVPCVALVDLW